jgi:putative SOS response-associated peptidase YedK
MCRNYFGVVIGEPGNPKAVESPNRSKAVGWNLDRDLPKYTPRFNVAPETFPNVPVIVRQKAVNECRLMRWELIPHWADDPSIGNRMINAKR